MPARAKKACADPDCPNVQPCPIHGKAHGWGQGGPRRRQRSETGWEVQRRHKRVLERDGYVCYRCGGYADEVDHVDRDGGDGDANLRAICGTCHGAKTQREAAEARRRLINR